MFAATESFLPFEIELSRERLQPIGFTTIGGMLEQKVKNAYGSCFMVFSIAKVFKGVLRPLYSVLQRYSMVFSFF